MRLFHCSDIQIRPLGRHNEFKSVFKKFYSSLIDNNACDGNSIIVVCGDIVQEKDKLKPETIMIMRSFFRKLVLISGCVVVIAGNHDLLENNKERLDNITPMITDLKGIHYLKNTGEYLINGINFVVNSIIDNGFIKDVKGCDKEDVKNVGLYHGMLNGCVLDNGLVMDGRSVSIKDFKKYDYVLLGDIHKHQYMNSAKTIAYSGSLVQQNFGEPYRGHGYIIWDLKKGNSQFVEIKSDYGFYNIRNEEDISKIESQYAYIRYYLKEKEEEGLSKLKELVEGKCQVLREEIRYITEEADETEDFDFIEQCKNNDIEAFKKQLEKRSLGESKSLKIIDDHKDLKEKLEISEGYGTGGYWTIDYLEFQNMLIYGGGHINKITFNNGVISICGNNAIGKSCILKLIIFALFDKTCSNNKNSIINKKENECYVKLQFSFSGNGGKKYCIIRRGKNRKNKNGKEVRFTDTLTENGVCINLEHSKKTMDGLRRFLGGYEDFIMTNVFSHSYNDISLLKMTDKARLEIFVKYFKLDMYKVLQDLCKKDLKELEGKLNYLLGSINGLNDSSYVNEKESQELILRIKKLKKNIDKKKIVGDSIIGIEKYNEIKNLPVIKHSEIINYDDLAVMKSKIVDRNVKWTSKDESELSKLWRKEFDDGIIECDKYYGDLMELSEIEKELNDIGDCHEDLDCNEEDIFNLKMGIIDIGEYKEWTDKDQKKLDKLWNPDFEGIDINKARVWEDSRSANKKEFLELDKRNKVFKEFIESSENVDVLKEVLQKELNGFYDGIREQIWKSGGKIGNDYKKFIEWFDLNEQKKEIIRNLDIHKENERIKKKILVIEKNKRYHDLVRMKKYVIYQKYLVWKDLIDKKAQYELLGRIDEIEKKLRYSQIKDYETNMGRIMVEREVEELEKKLKEVNRVAKIRLEIDEIKGKIEMLGIYKEIVDKNDIPKDILADNISGIVKMVNRFLRGFVGFILEVIIDEGRFEMFVMKNGVKLGIGDLSGYETFILNVAFKYALLKLSMINKCGCLFIDEGLDCIDVGNFDRLGEVFSGLKKVFGKIIVITHIEDIRRFEQWNIQISRCQGGNSLIKNGKNRLKEFIYN